jgi:general secretion pathway protein A
LRSHLAALDLDETKGYIERRLRLAGNPDASNLFPRETIEAVYRHCRGIPRLINTICENALIAAYSRQAPSVTPRIIDSIAMDFRLDVETRPAAAMLNSEDVSESMNVQKAARTLLELYSLLRTEQSREELRTR